jgi:hypothetical protein
MTLAGALRHGRSSKSVARARIKAAHAIVAGVLATAFGLAIGFQTQACNAGCYDDKTIITLDGAATPEGLEMCAVCCDPVVSASGFCSVLDAGPPATVLCGVNVCPE